MQRKAAFATMSAIAAAPVVARYTGDDDRREREANGEAFRSPLAPWVLVASNVGSEGIDLHTYSRHLVHFDLEWNPARMEQREGRIDRIGRVLKGPVSIYYVLVRGTYDERMFHQLVARQRWHGVLLGRTGNQVANRDDIDAKLITSQTAANISLNLHPRRGG
jgi:SNF2 family DNA or RNA helicase